MNAYPISIGDDALKELSKLLAARQYTNILVLSDQHTRRFCYPILKEHLPQHEITEIAAGETQKTITTCMYLWDALTAHKMDRQSVVINLGGGVIGDMGGFVASTYKRGIDFIQVPTTLLAMVDASVGGKLGVDFRGFKNHIGLFKEPQMVCIYPPFLETLSDAELHSGFAEVIKHHLTGDRSGWQAIKELSDIRSQDLPKLIQHSVAYKQRIVAEDPSEKGLRKVLNFGHTIGHAVEGHMLEAGTPVLHGEAVAMGIVAESWIAHKRGMLPSSELDEIEQLVERLYPIIKIEEASLEDMYQRGQNDKKNINGVINCTLLQGIGDALVNQAISQEEFYGSIRYYQLKAKSWKPYAG
ncbi:MAG: 3-dehydroquinate synthase [Bacteroidota bacterium]